MGTQVILASASPRRRELLKRWLDEYTVLPADIDETLPEGMPVSEGPGYLALHKARHLAEKYPEALVIGCDTGVMIDGRMLGKPRDRSEARQMLEGLSGRMHQVVTGCCLCYQGREHVFQDVTLVEMYPLSAPEIESYLDTGEYADKAGSYGIQGKGALLVRQIQGDYYNVMGLPIARLAREATRFLLSEE